MKRVWGKTDGKLVGLLRREVRRARRVSALSSPVLVQRYETVTSDPERGLAEIAGFLNIRLPADESAAIASRWRRERVKERIEERRGSPRQTVLRILGFFPILETAAALRRIGFRTGCYVKLQRALERHEPATLLHPGHVSDGDAQEVQLNRRERRAIERLAGELPPSGNA